MLFESASAGAAMVWSSVSERERRSGNVNACVAREKGANTKREYVRIHDNMTII